MGCVCVYVLLILSTYIETYYKRSLCVITYHSNGLFLLTFHFVAVVSYIYSFLCTEYISLTSRQIISISFLNRLGQSISRLGSSFFLLFLSSFHYFFSPLCFSALFLISRSKAYSSLVLAWIGCRLSENYKSEMYF